MPAAALAAVDSHRPPGADGASHTFLQGLCRRNGLRRRLDRAGPSMNSAWSGQHLPLDLIYGRLMVGLGHRVAVQLCFRDIAVPVSASGPCVSLHQAPTCKPPGFALGDSLMGYRGQSGGETR